MKQWKILLWLLILFVPISTVYNTIKGTNNAALCKICQQTLWFENKYQAVNSIAPDICGSNFKSIFLEYILQIKLMSTCENALRWMPQNTFDVESILVQVMAWCHQATSHYLSHCWPISMSPYGVTRPHWDKLLWKTCSSITVKPVKCINFLTPE